MTYHVKTGLGDAAGTFKAFGRGDADFTVKGLNGTPAESAKALAKILAMVKAVPGVTGADAAWQAGGTIKANYRMSEGSSVTSTGNAIKRNASGVGEQIDGSGLRVKVTCTRTGVFPSDVVRDAVAPAAPAAPMDTEGSGPVPAAYVPPPETSSMPIWPFAVGGSLLVLGVGAFFLLRKKKSTPQLTVKAA